MRHDLRNSSFSTTCRGDALMLIHESSGPRVEQWLGGHLERSTPVHEGGLVIGRAAGVAIRFDDTRVSRWHARIERHDDGSWRTFLDTSSHRDVRQLPRHSGSKPLLLHDGDKIRCGRRGDGLFEGGRTVLN